MPRRRKLSPAVLRQRKGQSQRSLLAAVEMQAPAGVGGSAPRQPSNASSRSANPSTRRWRALRARKLATDPDCELHLAGCEVVAVEVDHIQELHLGGDRWAWDNLRSACQPCHVQRHGKTPRTKIDPKTGLPLPGQPWHPWSENE